MTSLTPLGVLARRKWMIVVTFGVVVVSAAVLSQVQAKIYSTSSTLLVALNSDTPGFDTVQGSQAIARSYADIIESPNIARRVALRLGGGITTGEVGDATSFEALPETQLLKLNAEAASPQRAKRIADEYSAVFIEYARTSLSNTTQASITLADGAPLPGPPARPKPKLYLLVAAMLGLALGPTLALLRDRLDSRLRTLEDVETQLDVPVLASVPRRGRSDRSHAAFTEANEVLRTNLQFAKPEGPLRSIAITSAREGEGKTTMAGKLAVSSAANGLEVIAVEADLRRPRLQDELMREPREPLRPGLSSYLVDATTLEDCLYEIGRPGVRLVPAGPLPPNPAALLESGRARSGVAALVKKADLVIFDCPPLNTGADASIIADRVDGVVLVIDLQTSTANSVKQALRQLEVVNAPLLGLLVNRDRAAAPSRWYDHYASGAPQPNGGEHKRGKEEEKAKA